MTNISFQQFEELLSNKSDEQKKVISTIVGDRILPVKESLTILEDGVVLLESTNNDVRPFSGQSKPAKEIPWFPPIEAPKIIESEVLEEERTLGLAPISEEDLEGLRKSPEDSFRDFAKLSILKFLKERMKMGNKTVEKDKIEKILAGDEGFLEWGLLWITFEV